MMKEEEQKRREQARDHPGSHIPIVGRGSERHFTKSMAKEGEAHKKTHKLQRVYTIFE
jgi:hypothetical protein